MISRQLAKKLRAFIELMSENATDEQALDNILAYPKWEVGVTFKEDRPGVVAKFQEFADKGVYPSPLYNK